MATPNRVACLFFGEGPENRVQEKRFFALAEACGRFTPQIALREQEAIFLDLTRCANLYSEESFRARASALARRIAGREPRLSIAENASTALALARFGGRDRERIPPERLPIEALSDFVSPFGSDSDTRKKLNRMIAVMVSLGLKNFGDFLRLPHAGLASRFGKEAVELAARARGELPIAWPGFHPVERVCERALQGGENVEALVFILRGLIDRAMARLRGRSERAAVVVIGLELEKWSTVGSDQRASTRYLRIEFSLPQGGSGGILPIVQEQLGFALEREPLTAPVEAVSFEVLEIAPGRGAQKDFFSRREEEDEALETLFARISQKLGKENAFVAHPVERHLPESAYERSLKFAEVPEQSALPRRPARLLKRPEKVAVKGGLIVRAGGRRYRATSWEGPERIAGEWWSEGFERDYFRVTTVEGATLWLFQKGRPYLLVEGRVIEPLEFYLHGFFD